jgi:hypothetical protein
LKDINFEPTLKDGDMWKNDIYTPGEEFIRSLPQKKVKE